MYDTGEGTLQDYKKALKWYTKAAEQNYGKAQFNLGFMHVKGEGTPQDYVMAHMFWNIASISGTVNAKVNRDKVEDMMTSSQIEEAQQLAKEWMEKH